MIEDLPILQAMLKAQGDYFEQQDLSRTIPFVAELEGRVVGFGSARLIWQIEPILLDPAFKKLGSPHAQRKATYLIIRNLDSWLGDRSKNLSGIHSYFCTIRGRTMQKLALSFGMLRVYRWAKFFGRDT